MNAPGAQLNALRGISAPTNATPNQDGAKKAIIEKGLEKVMPELDRDQKSMVAARLLEKQGNNATINVGGKEISFESLAFHVAESVQAIESETDPMEEYYRWIYTAQEVITEMNTGGIEPHEIIKREDFLGDLEQREMDMRVCLSLYASCDSPAAKERLAFLQVKLAKLMEIRSAVKTSTKGPVEAALNPNTSDQDKERAEHFNHFLDNCQDRVGDSKFFSDDEYQLCLCSAQAIIALSRNPNLSEAKRAERERYARYLEERLKDLISLRDLGLKTKDRDREAMESFVELQKRIAAHQEILNLVKVANQPQRVNATEKEIEDDRILKEMCGLVLECRRRGKPVPDRILYKLGAHSFVPDYSISEELIVHRSVSRNDAIKRINELRGRQLIGIKPQSRQSFDAQKFNVLSATEKKKMAEFINERA